MSPTAEKTAASWARRQAHELVVHRMDLEAAAGVAARSRSTPPSPRTASTNCSTVIVPRWAHTEPLSSADASRRRHLHRHRPHLVGPRRPRRRHRARPTRTGAEDAHLQGDGRPSCCSASGAGPRTSPSTATRRPKRFSGAGERRHENTSRPDAVTGGTAELLADADRDGSWMLLVDGTPQSHVDLDDPTHLEFEYVRRMGHVLDLAADPGAPLDVLHLGGGALTLARYVAVDPARVPAARRRVRPAAHRPRPRAPAAPPRRPDPRPRGRRPRRARRPPHGQRRRRHLRRLRRRPHPRAPHQRRVRGRGPPRAAAGRASTRPTSPTVRR